MAKTAARASWDWENRVGRRLKLRDKAFRAAPRWATVTPEQGVLEPGAATDLHLTAHVTGGADSTAEVLASGGGCPERRAAHTASAVTGRPLASWQEARRRQRGPACELCGALRVC